MSNKYLEAIIEQRDDVAMVVGALLDCLKVHPCTCNQAMLRLISNSLEFVVQNETPPPEVIRALASIDAAIRALTDFEERITREIEEEE